jgi:hypothetical protein
VDLNDLRSAPDEARQAARCSRLQPGSCAAGPLQLINHHWLWESFDGDFPPLTDLHVAFGQGKGGVGNEHRARGRKLLHPRGEVRALTYRGVFHAQVAADGAHHDFTGVDTHADLDCDPECGE